MLNAGQMKNFLVLTPRRIVDWHQNSHLFSTSRESLKTFIKYKSERSFRDIFVYGGGAP